MGSGYQPAMGVDPVDADAEGDDEVELEVELEVAAVAVPASASPTAVGTAGQRRPARRPIGQRALMAGGRGDLVGRWARRRE